MPPMDAELLRRYLEFYNDLGIRTLYRRASAVPLAEDPHQASFAPLADARAGAAPGETMAVSEPRSSGNGSDELVAVNIAAPQPALPPLEPVNDSMLKILEDIGDCKRCRLHEQRNKIVFGVGNELSPLVFVGEGPGADEDAQGIPFVGRAGQLLTQMIEGTARKEGIPLTRDDVYICNVVKCRPPGNRTPEPAEMEMCGQFLYRQLASIRPKAIVALGGTAARALTGHKEGVTKMRGKWFQWRDIPVMVTYHPSYLLRPFNQAAKREAWEDLKKVLHYVYD
jgi:DNA polymerase